MSDRRKFSPAERRNWGYWDGKADGKVGKKPAWYVRTANGSDCRHPTDRIYGEAYWDGWYGRPHPNTKAP